MLVRLQNIWLDIVPTTSFLVSIGQVSPNAKCVCLRAWQSLAGACCVVAVAAAPPHRLHMLLLPIVPFAFACLHCLIIHYED